MLFTLSLLNVYWEVYFVAVVITDILSLRCFIELKRSRTPYSVKLTEIYQSSHRYCLTICIVL